MNIEILPGKKYRHFKGNEYMVLHIAKDSETEEMIVVYKALYGDFGIWTRDYKMFGEVIERDGMKMNRFTQIED